MSPNNAGISARDCSARAAGLPTVTVRMSVAEQVVSNSVIRLPIRTSSMCAAL
jgi:hypothetical protein